MKRSLTDLEAVVLAAAIALGVWLAKPIPLALAAAAVAAALGWRRPWMLCVAALALGSSLAARSEAGLRPPTARPYAGTVTLVADPTTSFGGAQAVVRAAGHRYQLTARRGAGGAVRGALAGEQLQVSGHVRPLPKGQDWLSSRHVVGRLDADRVEVHGPGGPVARMANELRRTLVEGASSMSYTQRSLFTGFVLGDDRDQPVTTTDDFRGSGLTHLLAVSGENVAFVLTLAGPVLRRLTIGGRWATTLGLIGFFAVLTRFEPSVLRATVMAGLAATAMALGRPASSLRILALGVGALLLVDPLLIRSVGFLLSVSACVGIVVAGARLAAVLPGPRVVGEALSVTLAAQLGVAPVQLLTFGGLPVASFPANLLAAPVAGLVMTWGLGAGLVAGLVGGPLATLLHLPTRLFIAWIEQVARFSSALPLGQLWWPHLAVLAVGLLTSWLAVRMVPSRWPRRGPVVRAAGLCLGAGALLWPAMAAGAPAGYAQPASGVRLWRAGGATVVELTGAAQPGDVLEGLRVAGIRRLDLVVLTGGGSRSATTAAALHHRWPIGAVWAPADNRVQGASTPAVGSSLRVGPLVVEVLRSRPRLEIRIPGPSG